MNDQKLEKRQEVIRLLETIDPERVAVFAVMFVGPDGVASSTSVDSDDELLGLLAFSKIVMMGSTPKTRPGELAPGKGVVH